MNLADKRWKELDDASLTTNQRILLRCHIAGELIHTGQYEDAREVLGDLWSGIGKRPNVKSLEDMLTAEVLLQCGTLSGWLGASRQIANAQEAAKDLISESAAIFERLGETSKVAAARSDLAICYWREGAYDTARLILEEAASLVSEDEVRAKIILRQAVVETCAGRNTETLRLLRESAPLFEKSTSHALKGRFHCELAIVLRKLGTAESQRDYFDKAILEYTAAIYHYQQAKHERYEATNENNLAFLLYKLGRYQQAHEHLDRARRVLARLKDAGLLAQVDETRARIFIAEQKYREANGAIAGAIQTLEKGGEASLLADALTAQGIVWARLGVYDKSTSILRRAMDVAEDAGALSNAGLSALTLIEEHGARRLNPTDLYNVYRRADRLLKGTQDAEEIARLRACARIVMRRLSGLRLHDKNFSLYGAMQELESKFIEQALEEGGGSVTHAAKLLGITHQSLANMLKSRHKSLLHKRTPAQRRLRSVIKRNKGLKE
jgi:tetratricopeptide (TPR) repeat protein